MVISELLTIFYNGDRNNLGINTTSYVFYWGYNSNWGSLGVGDRQKILDIPERFHKNMQTILPTYPLSTEASTDLSKALSTLETLINDANTIYAIIWPASTSNYTENKQELLSLLSGDNGIIILQSRLIEIEKWNSKCQCNRFMNTFSGKCGSHRNPARNEASRIQNETSSKQISKKDYATLSGEQSLSSVDLEKLKIEAKAEQIGSENRVKAFQNALWAIQSTMRISYAVLLLTVLFHEKMSVLGRPSCDNSTFWYSRKKWWSRSLRQVRSSRS